MNNRIITQFLQKLNSGDLIGAEALCYEVYQNNKENLHAIKNLALTLMLQKKYFEALHFYNEAVKLDSLDFDSNVNLAFLYLHSEDYELALKYCNQGISINPKNAIPHKTLGELYMALREFDLSISSLEKSFELFMENPSKYQKTFSYELKYRYLECLIINKREDDALSFIHEHGHDENINPDILSYQIKALPKSLNKDLINKSEILLEEIKNSSDPTRIKKSAGIYFALAAYFSKSDQKKSEQYYVDGNLQIDKIQNYRPLESQKYIKNIIKSFDELPSFDHKKNYGEGIIFIIGMPRSGTTLLESIVSNSPKVFTAGEMASFKNLIQYDITTKAKKNVDLIIEYLDHYISKINYLKKNKAFLIDKLPFNAFLIGFIEKLLPGAKILLIDRDPWDIATSVFQQIYIDKHYYSTKFFNIAMQIANYNFIRSYWLRVCNAKNILSIKYEDLVGNPKSLSDKVYKFLQIDHQIDFEARRGFYSNTASFGQVKDDISNKSVGKSVFSSHKDQFFKDLENQSKYWENFYQNH